MPEYNQISSSSPLISLFSNIVQILNGRDSNGNIICLGPQGTKIHRYLLLAFLAKSAVTFNILGKQIDNSLYFTLCILGKVASYFKSVKPFYTPINYDRRKVAQRIYEILAMRGYIDIKKMHGDTYVTSTEKGDEVCNQLLRELITFAQLSDMAPTLQEANLSYEVYKIKKGKSGNLLRETASLRMAAEKLAEDILEINSPFKEGMKAIEE